MDALARFLIYGVLLYTCVEGLVINICYPSLLPYLYKDLGLVAVYALVFLPRPGRFVPATLRGLAVPLGVFAATAISYLVIPGIGPFVALVGLKQKLFYLPLIGIGYYFIRSGRDIRRLFAMLALSAIPVAAFGIYLYFTGPAGLKQLGANYSEVIHTASTHGAAEPYWRVPGTFTSPGQFGAYLIFNGVMVAALLLTNWVRTIWRWIAGVSLTMVTLAMLGSGSRAPFVLLSVCVVAIVLLSRSIPRMAIAAFTVCGALALGFGYLGAGVKARFASIVDYEHVDRFERTYFAQLFLPALIENPLGSGLGLATVGARHFTAVSDMHLIESYLGILAIEMGVPGLAAMLWVIVAIALTVFRDWRRMGESPLSMIWYSLAAYILVTIAILPVSTSIDHGPTNLYFWFAIGVLARLAELDCAREKLVQTRLTASRRRARTEVA